MPRMAPEKDSRITARVPKSLRKELERLARDADRKLADYVRFALKEHVARSRRAA